MLLKSNISKKTTLIIRHEEIMEKKSGYSHILKYTGLFGSVQVLTILIGLVRNKLVALILGPSGLGFMSLLNSVASFVSQGTSLGLSTSAVRNLSHAFERDDKKQIQEQIAQIRSWSIVSAMLGVAVCALMGPLFNALSFSWGDHTLHFILLSPMVGCLGLAGGELAILKALRRLRSLAFVSIYGVLLSLVVSTPLFYFFRDSGVVPSLVVVALGQLLLTVGYSYKLYPLKLSLKARTLRRGLPMIRLGLVFMLASMFTGLVEVVIRMYLNNVASLRVVGLYNAGYMLATTYAGIVFSAMETDYFPRLSAICFQREEMTMAVNEQIEVSLLVVAPMLIALSVAMPLVLPLLYSYEFIAVLSMVQVALLSVYLRAVYLPIAYIPLSRGDSFGFLILECLSAVCAIVAAIFFYRSFSLTGIGIGLCVATLLDLLAVALWAYFKYGYKPSLRVVGYFLLQFPLGLLCLVVERVNDGWSYWIFGLALFFASLNISIMLLRRNTTFWQRLKAKFGAHRH